MHAAAFAYLEDQGVQEDDWVDVLQRPARPRPGVVDHRVGDLADQLATDLQP
jgi:hypothetical protein